MKKRITSLLLSTIIALSSINFGFAQETNIYSESFQQENDNTQESLQENLETLEEQKNLQETIVINEEQDITPSTEQVTKTADLKTSIIISYPESQQEFDLKNMKITLLNSVGSSLGSINLNSNTLNSTTTIGSYSAEVSSVITENLITEIQVNILGLNREAYKIKFEANGHKTYTTREIDLSKANQKLIIKTNNSTFTIGDVNNDGEVNQQDVEILEQKINENSTDRKYDLNGDGVVNINDIAFVNHHILTNGSEIVGPYEYFIEEAIDITTSDNELAENGIILTTSGGQKTGSLADLSNEDSVLKLEKRTPITEESPIEIPISFVEPVEMEVIEINSPSGQGAPTSGQVTVELEDGEILNLNFENDQNALVRASRSSTDTLTINLGRKVAVKKMTIKVTEVQGEDGSTNFVTIQDVKFLQDIGQNDAEIQTAIVTGLRATNGDKKVTLTWDATPNVTGYRVYYGTQSKRYTNELSVTTNSATIEGLKTLQNYYFTVAPIAEDWIGSKCEEIVVNIDPTTRPLKPDFVTVTDEQDRTVTITWGKAEDTLSYNVYYKKATDTNFTAYATGVTATTQTLTGLENDTEYLIYVTAVNNIGESSPSLTVSATPAIQAFQIPEIPTKNRISRDRIQSITMSNPSHYNQSLYPNGFNPEWLLDGDYNTSWVSRYWYDNHYFEVTFNEPIDTDYMVWVPRLDGTYRNVFDNYQITVWYEGEDLSSQGTKVAEGKITHLARETGYLVLPFPKQENVKKIRVRTGIYTGSQQDSNASELYFYDYNDIADRVSELFVDGSFTRLRAGVTQIQINKLIQEVNDLSGFILSRETLLKELSLATKLLAGDNSGLGIIKNGVQSRNGAADIAKHGISINNYEPLGIAGIKDEVINIYVEKPENENLELIVTQYFAEANKFSYSVPLANGRNEIKIANASNLSRDIGGPLYISYAGNRGDEIKVHVVGGTKIPYLEVSDFYTATEQEIKERIREFITHLEQYVPTLTGNLTIQRLNTSEISMPNVLLSLPAKKILEGINEGLTSIDDKIQRVYDNILAWEETIKVAYKVFGIDDYKDNGLQTRHNIRYMRMFGKAFMYAAGNHIGVGYDSCKDLIKGVPTSKLAEGATANSLFGWGIAHEIGHVMDRLGTAEVTNNIYSLMLQTYDGRNNTLASRLEESNYRGIYDKVGSESVGLSNDVFVQLGMYWQLHLAYDDAENPTNFYNQVYKKYIHSSSDYAQFTGIDKFAVVASDVANKDLTEFFTRHGAVISDAAKARLATKPREERAIYYLNDESRRQRIAGNNGEVTATITATATVNAQNPKEVNINITTTNDTNILGYEIIKNGKPIAFTKQKTYTDIIGSANNLAFEYKVKPINILGVPQAQVNAGEVRISYENVVDRSLYSTSTQNNVFTATMTNPQVVSGILLTLKESKTMPTTGTFTVKVKSQLSGEQEVETVAKQVNFATTENLATDKTTKFLVYLNKPGVESTDTRIWNYDAKEVNIEGYENLQETFEVDFISYPGDNIEFSDVAFGKLSSDYRYGTAEDEVIEAGTIIVTGSYRGDPIYNTMKIKGRFASKNGLGESLETEETRATSADYIERDINGYALFFAEALENEISTTISDGIFIFVPDIQAEAELQGSSCDFESVLPTQIKAELYRSDDAQATLNTRKTSDTIWITTPNIDTMPQIIIEQDNTSSSDESNEVQSR